MRISDWSSDVCSSDLPSFPKGSHGLGSCAGWRTNGCRRTDMSMFFGTHENKIDKKGRVSVPASFRVAVGSQNVPGVIIFPSWNSPGAYDACHGNFLATLSKSMASMELFSAQRSDEQTPDLQSL